MRKGASLSPTFRQTQCVPTIPKDDTEGQYLFDVATGGEGPGEVNRPCCLATGPEGHLWVRDDQNRRYSQFEITEDGASQISFIPMGHGMFGMRKSTTFDANGNVLMVIR